MATNIDKALYEAPLGIAAGTPNEPTIEIEVELDDGPPGNVVAVVEQEDFYKNLAEEMDEGALQRIATDLLEEIENDIESRKDWEKMYADGVHLLGLKYEERTDPWQGACGVFHPMITEAVIRFQSDTILETFPASGPVKSTIVGRITEDKEKAARRVEADLNWQLMENMPEFRPDHERMLWNLPGTGCAFKKVYKCPHLKRQTSCFVPAEDVIIPYGTTDLLTCERIAHRMRKTDVDIERLKKSGFWRDVTLPEAAVTQPDKIKQTKDKESGSSALMDERRTFYEVLVDLDLDAYQREAGDDTEEEENTCPYVVTFMDDGHHVVSIRRNWVEDDEAKLKRLHFVQYNYIPGYGAYGFGLFHLLGGFATSATSIMRQLVDAGTLSNLPGGLKTKGLRIKGDDQPISPGEFRDVDIAAGTLRDNILPMPYKEPSTTLYNLLLNIVEEGRRFASTNDLKISDMSSQAPVGTTLAVLERQLRSMTAVQARVHFSFKQELRLLAEIIKEDAEDGYPYDVDAPQGRQAKLSDYSQVSIIPVSDPNAATMSQRVVQYQAAIQLAGMAPQIYDQPELHRQMLTVLGIKNVGKLVPTEADIKVVDAVQENQNILMGKPVKAWAWQDHESHIRVHMAAMQDPLIQQLVGQNPQAQKIMGAMTSHITEHVGFAYRNRIQQAMGMSLPVLGKDDSLPQDVELQLSKALSQAAPMVLQQSQQIVAQQQAQKNAQDPVLVAQQMEQQNNKAEIERKVRKDASDAEIARAKVMIDAKSAGVDPETLQFEQTLAMEKAAEEAELARMKAGQQAILDAEKLRMQDQSHQQQMQIQETKQEQERRTAAHRLAMEAEERRQKAAREAEKHRLELRLKEEKAKSEIAAKKKAAEVAARKKPEGGAKK